MHNGKQFIEIIKRTALNAVESSKPLMIQFGTVTRETPLNVLVEQKITLERQHFIEKDTSKLNNLEAGTKLVLLRMQGGQRYYLLEVLRNDSGS